MAEETITKPEVKKVELTFDQKLFVDGWLNYHLSTKIENLKNPDPTQGTLGFRDALTKKQIVVNAPVGEWMRVLTELAKREASK